ncbi:MAG TPA: hypothetical protein VGN18_03840 [Jatrophihabitans sp.]|uniref:hypothetical protein n=1 Tax=Jatrophihabitans sp. TaxID=1932789 RepID=UPI002E03361F|nr:hypothetical protein [Jatrophihabitans sp.]
MDKHDQQRVAGTIRSSFDATLRDLSRDDGPAVAEVVTASYRRLAAEMARGFAETDARFSVDAFMTDALGRAEGQHALRLYEAVYVGRRTTADRRS